MTNIENLIIVRLLVAAQKGVTVKAVAKDIFPMVEGRRTRPEWDRVLGEIVGALEASGHLSRNSRGAMTPTEKGRKQALDFLGITTLPAQTKWMTLRNTHLIAKTLGLSLKTAGDKKKLGTAGGLRAAIIKKEYALPIADFPTITQAVEALAWKEIGVGTQASFAKNAVICCLLNRILELEHQLDLTQIKQAIPAKALGARKGDVNGLRLAVLRKLVEDDAMEDGVEIAEPEPGEAFDLKRFAGDILRTAGDCRSGRFGDDLVFISHVWNEFKRKHPGYGLDEAEFKIKLTDANRARFLDLSRADLVEAMNMDDVSASEIEYMIDGKKAAVFNFVRIGEGERHG